MRRTLRTFCFLLMVVLMPLRAWAGDAMAVQMALGEQHHQSVVAADCHEAVHTVAPDIVHEVGQAGGHSASHAGSDEHNCLHCDICQGKVHAVHLPVAPTLSSARELPAYGGNRIDLGPTASFFKPPIV